MSAVFDSPPLAGVPRITAPALRRALIAGMRRVVARRDALNKINVFPVPDGDTGSNLAFTLSSVLAGSLSRRQRSAGALLRDVAEDAIDGARGNSGAILAQFLYGAGEIAGDDRVLTPHRLAEAALAGAEQAHSALAQPREGTILSVIRVFAETLHAQALTGRRDLAAWFGAALDQARRALADTPRQLAVLRQAGVVDAGAQGFVDLLEGIQAFIASGAAPDVEASDAAGGDFAGEHWHEDADAARPWCSECLIECGTTGGDAIDRDAVHAALAAFGASSVVVAGGRGRVRVHAHVAEPSRLFEALGRFGRISGRKAEDMRVQHRTARDAQGVAVVTDSGADLPRELVERLGIHVVPVRVSFGAEDFLDKVSISPHEFYARIRAGAPHPQTSQPPPGDFRRQFEFLLAHHPELLYVGISGRLSGTLQSGETAANRADPQRARAVDSGHGTCGQGLLAIAAAEAAARGLDAPAVAEHVQQLRAVTDTFAIARDIRYAVRGGRIPRWALPVVEGLRLTPIARIRPDGTLGMAGALFGGRDVPRRFSDYIARRLPKGRRWRVLVGHCDCAADGETLLAALMQWLDVADGWLVEAGPAIGAHAGPGALVVGTQPLAS